MSYVQIRWAAFLYTRNREIAGLELIRLRAYLSNPTRCGVD